MIVKFYLNMRSLALCFYLLQNGREGWCEKDVVSRIMFPFSPFLMLVPPTMTSVRGCTGDASFHLIPTMSSVKGNAQVRDMVNVLLRRGVDLSPCGTPRFMLIVPLL